MRSVLLLCLAFCALCHANLEGPFLFFGPKSLEKYRRPALKTLDQDDLIKLYRDQAAIVVFNNQNSLLLSSGNFPRLRKMLEGQTTLVLPQDFLDVHPDYISNETQVLTLLGPWSERDAQMTETFARLQDIYGPGRVLGVLGNSVSQSQSSDYDTDWSRVRRQAPDSSSTTSSTTSTEEDRPGRTLPKYSLYNATSQPGKGALLYSSGWPELKWPDGSLTTLDTPVGEPTVKPTRLYTILVVRFADRDNNRDKITLEFSFRQNGGWWTAVGVEVRRGLENTGLNLQAPSSPYLPSAVVGRAFQCSLPIVYASEDASLTFPNIQMQPFMESTEKFSDSFNCVGFTSAAIWSGLMVAAIMIIGLAGSLVMITSVRSTDRFETNRSKQLTVTVSE